MMEAAFFHLPTPSDSEKLRTYQQRQPVQTPLHYPQVCTFPSCMIFSPLFRDAFLEGFERIKLSFGFLFFWGAAESTPSFWLCWIFSTIITWDTIFCLLLHGRDKSSIFGSQGSQEAKLALPHKVHDVVSASRRAQNYQWGIRAGELIFFPFSFLTFQRNLLGRSAKRMEFFCRWRGRTYISTMRNGGNERKKDSHLNTGT